MCNLVDIKLVPNLATTAHGGTVVYSNAYQGILRGILTGICFLPHVTKMYSLEDIELVPNLATTLLA